MGIIFRLGSAAAIAASAAMIAAPIGATELPAAARPAAVAATGMLESSAVNAHHYRKYRRDRVDAGDVIGAVVVLGAIAAVASAASSARGDRRSDDRYRPGYPYPDERYPDYEQREHYRSRAPEPGYDGGRGIDRAVDMCAREIGRTARIDTVETVNRSGEGWHVSGRLDGGARFACSVGPDGRIDSVDYGQGNVYRGSEAGDRQWDDARYAAARAARDGADSPDTSPTEDEDDDGRYETADSPDFSG